jgi:hypothetical protein
MNTEIQNLLFYVAVVFVLFLSVNGALYLLIDFDKTDNAKVNYHLECPEREKQQAFMLQCIKHSGPNECASASNTTYCYSVKDKFDIEEIVIDKIRGWIK